LTSKRGNEGYQNERALIIGATGETGRAISLQLAGDGFLLTLHGGHSRESLDLLLSEVNSTGIGRHEGFLKEVRRPEDITGEIKKRLPFDILVVVFGPFARLETGKEGLEATREMVELNFLLPVHVASLCLPGMVKKNFGRIIFFGGTCTEAVSGFKTTALYSATKTALASYTKSIALGYARYGVTCNMIVPGFIRTSQYDTVELEKYSKLIPAGRFGEPDEVAGLVGYLVGEKAGYVNGALISLNGGLKL